MPTFIGVLIRGPSAMLNSDVPIPMAAHPGITAYEVITPSRMPPSENPDVSKIPPPGVMIGGEVEDELPPDKGDVRLCSAD
jgi:hypothetical protein